MGLFSSSPPPLPSPEGALPGRSTPVSLSGVHAVLGASMLPPFPEGSESVQLGMGCFWGSEELYWEMDGVITTAVGYGGGITPNPTYEEVCTGMTGHTELALVVWDPARVTFAEILAAFWETHDPTQGMRQGNDVGTQYRSAIFTTTDAHQEMAERSAAIFQRELTAAGREAITTQIAPAGTFYYAEEHHQQYLAKNPYGYRCHARSGVSFPLDALTASAT